MDYGFQEDKNEHCPWTWGIWALTQTLGLYGLSPASLPLQGKGSRRENAKWPAGAWGLLMGYFEAQNCPSAVPAFSGLPFGGGQCSAHCIFSQLCLLSGGTALTNTLFLLLRQGCVWLPPPSDPSPAWETRSSWRQDQMPSAGVTFPPSSSRPQQGSASSSQGQG